MNSTIVRILAPLRYGLLVQCRRGMAVRRQLTQRPPSSHLLIPSTLNRLHGMAHSFDERQSRCLLQIQETLNARRSTSAGVQEVGHLLVATPPALAALAADYCAAAGPGHA